MTWTCLMLRLSNSARNKSSAFRESWHAVQLREQLINSFCLDNPESAVDVTIMDVEQEPGDPIKHRRSDLPEERILASDLGSVDD